MGRHPEVVPVTDRRRPEASTADDWLRELVALNRGILAAVEGLRADQQEQQRRDRSVTALTHADRAFLGRLLPVLAATFGSEAFSSRDVAESQAPGLRLVLGDTSVKRLSKVLGRAEGVTVGEYLVRRQGMEDRVAAWRIYAVPNR